jgi:hypothetical protein
MHLPFFIQHTEQFIFIALIALPLPIVMLSTPFNHFYEKVMRYKYYTIVKRYHDNPYQVTQEELHKIFPYKSVSELSQVAYYLEDEYVFMDN